MFRLLVVGAHVSRQDFQCAFLHCSSGDLPALLITEAFDRIIAVILLRELHYLFEEHFNTNYCFILLHLVELTYHRSAEISSSTRLIATKRRVSKNEVHAPAPYPFGLFLNFLPEPVE